MVRAFSPWLRRKLSFRAGAGKRQPIRTSYQRPVLERLEDRTLLDTTAILTKLRDGNLAVAGTHAARIAGQAFGRDLPLVLQSLHHQDFNIANLYLTQPFSRVTVDPTRPLQEVCNLFQATGHFRVERCEATPDGAGNLIVLTWNAPQLPRSATFQVGGATGFSYFDDRVTGQLEGSLRVDAENREFRLTFGVDLVGTTPTFFVTDSTHATFPSRFRLDLSGPGQPIRGELALRSLAKVQANGTILLDRGRAELVLTDRDSDHKLRLLDLQNDAILREVVRGDIAGTFQLNPLRLTASLPLLDDLSWSGVFTAPIGGSSSHTLSGPTAASVLTQMANGFFDIKRQYPFLAQLDEKLNQKIPVLNKSLTEILGLERYIGWKDQQALAAGTDFGVIKEYLEARVPGFKVRFSPADIPQLLNGDMVDLITYSPQFNGTRPCPENFEEQGEGMCRRNWNELLFKEPIFTYGIPLILSLNAELTATLNAHFQFNVGLGIDTRGLWIREGTGFDVGGGVEGTVEGNTKVLFVKMARLTGTVGLGLNFGVHIEDPTPGDGSRYSFGNKVHLQDIFGNTFADSIFDAIRVELSAELKLLAQASLPMTFFTFQTDFGGEKVLPIFRLPLVTPRFRGRFSGVVEPPPMPASFNPANGHLTLNGDGPAGTRDDVKLARRDGQVEVSWGGYATQRFPGVTKVIFNGGAGNDKLSVADNFPIRIEAHGGVGNDTLEGGEGEDSLYGDGGNDWLDGRGGNDTLYGGIENDKLWGRGGVDHLYGEGGNDELRGGADGDRLWGGPEDDRLYGEAGDDVLEGEGGADLLTGNDGNDVLDGGMGGCPLPTPTEPRPVCDLLDGGKGVDRLYGRDGNNDLIGGDDSDFLYGGIGKDRLYGENGTDDLTGGDGDDSLYGGDGDDVLNGGSGNDMLLGEDGNDNLSGGDGDDNLHGGAGNDVLVGDENNDILNGGIGHDDLRGQRGDDHLLVEFERTGEVQDDLSGGDGRDTFWVSGTRNDDRIAFHQPGSGLYFEATLRTPAGGLVGRLNFLMPDDVELIGIEAGVGDDEVRVNPSVTRNLILVGGLGNDTLIGGGGQDSIVGDDGNDLLVGGGHDDILVGGVGNDTLDGSAGNDLLDGDDRAESRATGRDVLLGGPGRDVLYGGPDNDRLEAGPGIFGDRMYGGAGDDTLLGGDGRDMMYGEDGQDILLGGDMGDVMDGGGNDAGRGDTLLGEKGRDAIQGGEGNDLALAWTDNVIRAQFGLGPVVLLTNDQILQYRDQLDRRLRDLEARQRFLYTQYPDPPTRPQWVIDELTELENEAVLIRNTRNDLEVYQTIDIDVVAGGAGSDTLVGSPFNDDIDGGPGDDTIVHSAGRDLLRGDLGTDTYLVNASDGPDRVRVQSCQEGGNFPVYVFFREFPTYCGLASGWEVRLDRIDLEIVRINALGGDDVLRVDFGTRAPIDVYFDGGPGHDTLDARDLRARATLDGGNGDDILYGGRENDSLNGGPDQDQLYGGAGNDTLRGGTGNDLLNGGADDDQLYGDSEDDLLIGSPGNDRAFGGTGNDTYRITSIDPAPTANDYIRVGVVNTVLTVFHGPNPADVRERVLELLQVENLNIDGGQGGSDTLIVEPLAPYTFQSITLDGGEGDDLLEVRANVPAILRGGPGHDILCGGPSSDTLYGGPGNDTLSGTAGRGACFSDSFTNGSSPLWRSEVGNWIASGGVYRPQTLVTQPTYTNLRYVLGDFDFEVDINDVQDGGVWLRSSDNRNGVVLVTRDTGLYWHVRVNGNWGDILNRVDGLFAPRSNIRVRVAVRGDTYSAFLNGGTSPVTTLTTNRFPNGKVGLYSSSTQTFDNVRLTGDADPQAGAGSDWLEGDDGNDILTCGPGDDRLFGGLGNDVLDGGRGSNYLEGGPGDDYLKGYSSTSRGGPGNDRYEVFDSDMRLANWSTQVFAAGSGDRVWSEARSSSERGNYLEIVQEHARMYGQPRSDIKTGHTFHGMGSYDPSTQGPISTIDFSFDQRFSFWGNLSEHQLGLFLQQGTSSYIGSFGVYRPPTDGVWRPFSLSTTSSNFERITDRTHPDFSASGQPIRVGFYTYSTGTGPYCGPIVVCYGLAQFAIDNFRAVFRSTTPGPTATFRVTPSTTSTIIGSPFQVTVTAFDALGNLATNYRGTVSFSSSDQAAGLPANYTFQPGDNGVRTFDVTLRNYGQQTVTATDVGSGAVRGTTPNILVTPAPVRFVVTATPSTVTAGNAFTLTVAAVDSAGIVVPGYRGTIRFNSNDGLATLPGNYTFQAADGGQRVFTGVVLRQAGGRVVDVTDGTISGSASLTVTPAAADRLILEDFPLTPRAGDNVSVRVTARDRWGNAATGYRGQVCFSVNDTHPAVRLPACYTFVPADGGTRGFSNAVTLATAGSRTLTATEQGGTGLRASISATVVSLAATRLTVTGFPSPTIAGTPGTFTVTVYDVFDNIATGYRGTVRFSSSDGQAVLRDNYTFTAADNGSKAFTVTLRTAGRHTLSVVDVANSALHGSEPALSEFRIPTPNSGAHFITTGSDGNLWFTEYLAGKIGRITPAGQVTELPISISGLDPVGITAGPDGNLWFTEWSRDKIGRLTPAGVLTEFALPVGARPNSITVGPDRNLWFTMPRSNQIGRATPGGVVTVFTTGIPVGFQPYLLTAGPDGNVWFTSEHRSSLGRITPAGQMAGQITVFPLAAELTGLEGITTGPDGNLWFTARNANKIGRFSLAGPVDQFPLPAGSDPIGITAGPDGNLWFTLRGSSRIGRITPTGTLWTVPTSTPNSGPFGITVGPDGNLWFVERFGNQIGRMSPGIVVRPAAATQLFVQMPDPVVAGGTYPLQVTALDAYNNVASGYRGTVRFTSTDSQASLPPDYTFTASDNGIHIFPVVLKTAGSQSIITRDIVNGTLTYTRTVIVTPAAANRLDMTGVPAQVQAGTSFSVTVTVRDAFGNLTPGYRGTVTFTSTDGQATLPANYTFTGADNGVHTFTNGVTLRTVGPTAGRQTITARDTATNSIIGSATATVTPAATNRLELSGVPGSVQAGTPFSVRVTARDAFGNLTPDYLRTVRFHADARELDPTLPPNYRFVAGDNGSRLFSNLVLRTPGSRQVCATDTVTGTITGCTPTINVTPVALTVNGTASADTIVLRDSAVNPNFFFEVVVNGQVRPGESGPWVMLSGLTLNGLDGNDTIRVQNGRSNVPVTLVGGAGNDTLWGSPSNDLLQGGDGDDWLIGAGGFDRAFGGAGTNWYGIEGSASDDVLRVVFEPPTVGAPPVLSYYIGGALQGRLLELSGIQRLSVAGLGGSDRIRVESLPPSLGEVFVYGDASGDSGNDVLDVRGLPATVAAFLYGGRGNDELYSGGGNYQLYGDDGDDRLYVGSGSGTLFGGDGFDLMQGPDVASTWNLTGYDEGTLATEAGAVAFNAVENLTGGAAEDTFVFGDGLSLTGFLDGGLGVNTLDYSSWTSDILVILPLGMTTAVFYSLPGGIANIQNAVGGAGNDILVGDDFSNVLSGGAGRDLLIAGGASYTGLPDTLLGGEGEDILIGGFTLYDTDPDQLLAIRDYWAGEDDYATRVANLTTPESGVPLLDASTVFYNYAEGGNTLLGGEDALDLFFGQPTADANDWDGVDEWFFEIY